MRLRPRVGRLAPPRAQAAAADAPRRRNRRARAARGVARACAARARGGGRGLVPARQAQPARDALGCARRHSRTVAQLQRRPWWAEETAARPALAAPRDTARPRRRAALAAPLRPHCSAHLLLRASGQGRARREPPCALERLQCRESGAAARRGAPPPLAVGHARCVCAACELPVHHRVHCTWTWTWQVGYSFTVGAILTMVIRPTYYCYTY